MNKKAVAYTLGNLLLCVAVALLAPLLIAAYYARAHGEGDLMAFVWTVVVTVAAGLILRYTCRTEPDLHNREGFAVVALGWMVTALRVHGYTLAEIGAEAGLHYATVSRIIKNLAEDGV